jgi:hypothetical protein
MDVCGPMPSAALNTGNLYLLTFLDEYSSLATVRTTKTREAVPAIIQETLTLLENQTGARVQSVQTDRGGEFMKESLREWYRSKGIQHDTSAPYTPQQNGHAERLNRTLLDRVRAMLVENELKPTLWEEAVQAAVILYNRSPSAGKSATPWQLFFGVVPDVSMLRVFGSPAYVTIPQHERSKLSPQARSGVLVGYGTNCKGYRVLIGGGVITSNDVTFDERPLAVRRAASAATASSAQVTGAPSSAANAATAGANDDQPAATSTTTVRDPYPQRDRRTPNRYTPLAVLTAADATATSAADDSDEEEPLTAEQALADPRWHGPMREEYQSLLSNDT